MEWRLVDNELEWIWKEVIFRNLKYSSCIELEIAYWGPSWFVLVNKYYSGDQINKNQMGGACGTYGNTKDAYRVFIEKSEEPLGRPRMVVLTFKNCESCI